MVCEPDYVKSNFLRIISILIVFITMSTDLYTTLEGRRADVIVVHSIERVYASRPAVFCDTILNLQSMSGPGEFLPTPFL